MAGSKDGLKDRHAPYSQVKITVIGRKSRNTWNELASRAIPQYFDDLLRLTCTAQRSMTATDAGEISSAMPGEAASSASARASGSISFCL